MTKVRDTFISTRPLRSGWSAKSAMKLTDPTLKEIRVLYLFVLKKLENLSNASRMLRQGQCIGNNLPP